MGKLKSQSVKRLYETILKLETVDECDKFFEDICTIKEIVAMAQRMDVAMLLHIVYIFFNKPQAAFCGFHL